MINLWTEQNRMAWIEQQLEIQWTGKDKTKGKQVNWPGAVIGNMKAMKQGEYILLGAVRTSREKEVCWNEVQSRELATLLLFALNKRAQLWRKKLTSKERSKAQNVTLLTVSLDGRPTLSIS